MYLYENILYLLEHVLKILIALIALIEILFAIALHLRWLTIENLQNYETVKGGCIPSKNNFKTQKHNKVRWLASDINFKLIHTGCPIAHGLRKYRMKLEL